MRKLVFIILIVIFSTIYYNSNQQNEVTAGKTSFAKIETLIKNSTKDVSIFNSKEVAKALPAEESAVTDFQKLSTEQFEKWVEKQATSLDSTKNDTDEAGIQLRSQAQTLLPQQLLTLRDIAGNSLKPINERILSAFLISLNPSALSQEALFDGAKSEMPDQGHILPHSEAELKHTQELAIRYMQVDELFQQAKSDANARNKLKLLMLEAHAAQVRSYAEKRLKELK